MSTFEAASAAADAERDRGGRGPRVNSSGVGKLMQAVAAGVATAAALWLFTTVQSNREDLVRVQTSQEFQSGAVKEIKEDIKAMRADVSTLASLRAK